MKLKSSLIPLGLVLALSTSVFATQSIQTPINSKEKCCNTQKCDSENMDYKQKKQKKFKPFLIQSKKMPHLTKLIKQNWNNEELNLIGNQKKELLEIRKRTMTSIKDLSPRIKKLEEEIIMFTLQKESKNDIFQMVKELAKLKAEATRTHIMCIKDTKEILTKKQLDFLMK